MVLPVVEPVMTPVCVNDPPASALRLAKEAASDVHAEPFHASVKVMVTADPLKDSVPLLKFVNELLLPVICSTKLLSSSTTIFAVLFDHVPA
jgi:hypothetical protein